MYDIVQSARPYALMPKFSDATSENGHSVAILDKIAAALDCPKSAFSSHDQTDPAETSELLRLWFMIEHERDRAKILAVIGNAVAAQSAKNAAE